MESVPFPELKAAFDRDPRSLLWQVPGFFVVDKPCGPTSHGMVSLGRRVLGMRRIGHGGTLDPMASGVLLLMAGNAARLFDSLQIFGKEYVASFRLGSRTDTQDATGIVTEAAEMSTPLDRLAVEAALARFRGEILQVPPMYSALKRDGKKLVDLARKGETVERDPRPVTVHALELLEFDGYGGQLRMAVSKGFYVRTLIDDLGEVLGTYAHMSALQRTRIGPFSLAEALTPEAFQERFGSSPRGE